VYTDVYWYTYQPFTWGVSIYGGGGLGFGFAVNYPVYYSDWRYTWYDYDWYYPYYSNSWYWGYDPYYYSWYTPAIININIGYRWRYNHWWRNDFRAWNRHNYWWRNNYRPSHYNRYYASGYSSRDYYDGDRRYSYNRDLRSENSGKSSRSPAMSRSRSSSPSTASKSSRSSASRSSASRSSVSRSSVSRSSVSRSSSSRPSSSRSSGTSSRSSSSSSRGGGRR
jgi:hypothetical protein